MRIGWTLGLTALWLSVTAAAQEGTSTQPGQAGDKANTATSAPVEDQESSHKAPDHLTHTIGGDRPSWDMSNWPFGSGSFSTRNALNQLISRMPRVFEFDNEQKAKFKEIADKARHAMPPPGESGKLARALLDKIHAAFEAKDEAKLKELADEIRDVDLKTMESLLDEVRPMLRPAQIDLFTPVYDRVASYRGAWRLGDTALLARLRGNLELSGEKAEAFDALVGRFHKAIEPAPMGEGLTDVDTAEIIKELMAAVAEGDEAKIKEVRGRLVARPPAIGPPLVRLVGEIDMLIPHEKRDALEQFVASLQRGESLSDKSLDSRRLFAVARMCNLSREQRDDIRKMESEFERNARTTPQNRAARTYTLRFKIESMLDEAQRRAFRTELDREHGANSVGVPRKARAAKAAADAKEAAEKGQGAEGETPKSPTTQTSHEHDKP